MMPNSALITRNVSAPRPDPNRKTYHSGPVMHFERRYHFPVHNNMNASTSTAPPRNSMNSPRGPSINRNDVMIIVPVRSNQFAMPDIPSSGHGIRRPPRK